MRNSKYLEFKSKVVVKFINSTRFYFHFLKTFYRKPNHEHITPNCLQFKNTEIVHMSRKKLKGINKINKILYSYIEFQIWFIVY